ncbi:MAG: SlyX family protein [Pseudomonadales bacterium]|nr:SlyX family protein [Pseudomonadales bacterium]
MVAKHSDADHPIDARQLIEMQTKLTFQEDAMQQLSDVVAQQQQDIMSLQGQMKQLISELNAVLGDLEQGSLAKSPVDQKPPHY